MEFIRTMKEASEAQVEFIRALLSDDTVRDHARKLVRRYGVPHASWRLHREWAHMRSPLGEWYSARAIREALEGVRL